MNSQKGGTPSYPDDNFDKDHEGHWGWRADEVLDDLPGWLGSYTPDVVLMHLGTNDARASQSTDSTIEEFRQIIAALRKDNERVVILLAKLIPSTSANDRITAISARLDALASETSTTTSPVIVVDQATGFDAVNDTFDGIHPNETGEIKMSDKWYTAILANWPKQGGACDK